MWTVIKEMTSFIQLFPETAIFSMKYFILSKIYIAEVV